MLLFGFAHEVLVSLIKYDSLPKKNVEKMKLFSNTERPTWFFSAYINLVGKKQISRTFVKYLPEIYEIFYLCKPDT